MTQSTLTKKPERTAPESSREPVKQPEEHDLIYHQSTTGSFRQFLLGTGAILLSIMINLGLLAVIGYVDTARSSPSSTTSQSTTHTIQIQQNEELKARKSSPSKNQQNNKTVSSETARQPKPKPQPVAKAEPLKLDNISSNFDVEPPRIPLRTSAAVEFGTDQQKQSTNDASRSSGTEQGKAFRKGKLDRLPRKVAGPDPEYPLDAKQNRTTGYVLLELDVSRDGTVSNVNVLDWTGSPEFKQSAMEAVQKWTFEPGRRDGTPVDARDLRQRIRFELVGD